ncbi:hypothetical protein LTR37_001010 [Vermiconidia calcicola]|uniref:Uncharacterized protein n=1 Tax=Vermiconidia calcicola TaxID=1690605 RepID=A0ACC3NWU8_9PEZI|nr:hypothetical protein LTR37_001010 [Vermiconidia calcicola]
MAEIPQSNVSEEDQRIERVMNALPPNLDNQARMSYWMVEQARKAYRQRDFGSCEDQCKGLLLRAFLPQYARIQTLHLLSGVVPMAQAKSYLDEALVVCDEIENGRGSKVRASQEYRAKTMRLQEKFEKDEAVRVFVSGGFVQASKLVGMKVPEKKMPEKPHFDTAWEMEEWRRDQTEDVREMMELGQNYVMEQRRKEDEQRAAEQEEAGRVEEVPVERPTGNEDEMQTPLSPAASDDDAIE